VPETGGCIYTAAAAQHSPQLGWMADGIPIYGPNGAGGVQPADLDVCRGHDSDQGFYHYHGSASYLVGCLRGCIRTNLGNNGLSSRVRTTCQAADASVKQDYTGVHAAAAWVK
jgi:hypothetical protein